MAPSQAYTTNFDAVAYIKARPRYQSVVLDLVKSWHQAEGSNAKFDRCLDVGCGPGILTYPLAESFKSVVGLDPSPMMLEAARTSAVPDWLGMQVPQGHTVDFVEGSIGPDSDGKFNQLESHSFDFILAATAIHWVDWKSDPKGEKVWKEFGRLLRPGGSIFFVGYGTDTIMGHPTIDDGARRLLNDPETGLGKYFDQESPLSPTRLGLNLYSTLPTPPTDSDFATDQTRLVLFDAEERLKTIEDARDVKEVQDGGHLLVVRSKKDKNLPEWIRGPLLAHNSDEGDACRLVAHGSNAKGGKQRSVTTLNDLAKYYHSASAWPRYLEDHPEEKEMQKQGKDFIMTGLEKIRQEDAKANNSKPVEWDEPLDVLSPVTVFVARKKL